MAAVWLCLIVMAGRRTANQDEDNHWPIIEAVIHLQYIMYEICFFERKKKEKEDIDPKYVVAGLFCLYL